MAIAEVGAGSQRAVATGAGVANLAKAFPANVASGSLLIVAGACYNVTGAPATIAVTDTRSTSYTVLTVVGGASSQFRVFLAYGIAPTGGACTVTVDPTGSADIGYAIDEFSGVNATPLDVNGGSSTGLSTTPSDALTTITANDLIIGVESHDGGPTITPGASWTQIGENESVSFQPFNAEFGIVTTAQAYTVDWTLSVLNSWAVYTAAFKPATAAASTDPPFNVGQGIPNQYRPEIVSV